MQAQYSPCLLEMQHDDRVSGGRTLNGLRSIRKRENRIHVAAYLSIFDAFQVRFTPNYTHPWLTSTERGESPHFSRW